MFTLEVFSVGIHTDAGGMTHEWTALEVGQMATSYDPAIYEAPLVIGHPATDDPAYGRVRALNLRADGILEADIEEVDESVKALVNAGAYKYISIALWFPEDASNPRPGFYCLRHVGLLGAVPPAVKGLRPARFREGKGREFRLKDPGREATRKEKSMDPQELARLKQELEAKETTLKANEAALKAREAEIGTRFAEIQKREGEARRQSAATFAEKLVTDRRILPAQKGLVVELLHGFDATLTFAEGDKQVTTTGRAALERLLSELPQSTPPTGEMLPGEAAPGALDPGDLALKARAYVEEARKQGRAVSFSQAVATVGKAGGV